MFKKTILIDLDGVLNEYTGNYDSEFIPKPKEGAKNFLEEISKSFKLILFTTRDLNKTKEWLIKNEFVKYFSEKFKNLSLGTIKLNERISLQ